MKDYNPEDMPIIQIDTSGCKEYKREDYIDLLSVCGTFDTKDCISTKDICKLLDNKSDSWQEWISAQIEQEGLEEYKEWYNRMFERGAICEGLCESHNKLFNGEKE